MPLVVEDTLDKGIPLGAGFSRFLVRVSSKYLSEPFEVAFSDTVHVRAKILQVEPVGRLLSPKEREVVERHLIGKEVWLRLVPGLAMDFLYFSEEGWSALRDAGILPREYSIKLEIHEMVFLDPSGKEKKRLPVYPLKSVIAKA